MPESITHDLKKVSSETFNPMEIGNLPESANEQVPEGFSRVPNKALIFSISSWLNSSYSNDFS